MMKSQLPQELFPTEFDFYNEGRITPVKPQHQKSLQINARLGVAYQIQGDDLVWMILVFDSEENLPLYLELGNIFASKIADQFFQSSGTETTISPPRILKTNRVYQLIDLSKKLNSRTYLHESDKLKNPFQVILFDHSFKEALHV